MKGNLRGGRGVLGAGKAPLLLLAPMFASGGCASSYEVGASAEETPPELDGSLDGAGASDGGVEVAASVDGALSGDTVVDAGASVDAAWTGRPPAAPLFVRNPYFNIWSAADSVSGTWPTLWAGEIKGMTGIARIDGVAHVLIGSLSPSGLAQLNTAMSLLSSSMTPTETEYVLGAGGVAITLEFLSPVEIDDLSRLSAPIAYLSMSAQSTDGQSHSVSLYVDITGEWANGDSTQDVQWQRELATHSTGTLTALSITSSNPQVLSEKSDYVQWGAAFLASDSPNMTTAIGSDVSLRTMAATTGVLA